MQQSGEHGACWLLRAPRRAWVYLRAILGRASSDLLSARVQNTRAHTWSHLVGTGRKCRNRART